LPNTFIKRRHLKRCNVAYLEILVWEVVHTLINLVFLSSQRFNFDLTDYALGAWVHDRVDCELEVSPRRYVCVGELEDLDGVCDVEGVADVTGVDEADSAPGVLDNVEFFWECQSHAVERLDSADTGHVYGVVAWNGVDSIVICGEDLIDCAEALRSFDFKVTDELIDNVVSIAECGVCLEVYRDWIGSGWVGET